MLNWSEHCMHTLTLRYNTALFTRQAYLWQEYEYFDKKAWRQLFSRAHNVGVLRSQLYPDLESVRPHLQHWMLQVSNVGLEGFLPRITQLGFEPITPRLQVVYPTNCATVRPVPSWHLCHCDTCATVTPVPPSDLCHRDTCATVTPVPPWHPSLVWHFNNQQHIITWHLFQKSATL